MIVGGVAGFMYKDGKASESTSAFTFGLGEILLVKTVGIFCKVHFVIFKILCL